MPRGGKIKNKQIIIFLYKKYNGWHNDKNLKLKFFFLKKEIIDHMKIKILKIIIFLHRKRNNGSHKNKKFKNNYIL